MQVTLIDTIVGDKKSASDANKILVAKYKLPASKNPKQLHAVLNSLARNPKVSNEIFTHLGNIHPHRELILSTVVPVEKTEEHLNCTGCGGSCGGTMSADGDNQPAPNGASKQLSNLELVRNYVLTNKYSLLVSGVVVVATAVISYNMGKKSK